MRCVELWNPGAAAVVDVEHMEAVVDMVGMLNVVGMLDTVNVMNVMNVVDVVDVVDLAVSSAAAGPCDGAAVQLARPWGPSPSPACSSGSGGSSSDRLTPERRSDGA